MLGLFSLNHTSMVFYGKLEDQFGNALGNIPVGFNYRVNNGFSSGFNSGKVMSDVKGYFTITGYTGARLWVVPRIPGYAIASENREAIYSSLWPENERAHPDPNHPVVIKMWKVQGAEPLVGIGRSYKLPYTNAPICFDLVAGEIVSTGGDIRITVNRPPGIIDERNPQPWSATFAGVDGGLKDSEASERITYFAPDDGYRPSIEVIPTRGHRASGVELFDTGFYVKSRHGQVYSKLGVLVRINENTNDPLLIEFSGIANTNHSRNWEGAGGTYLNP